jgi:glucan phosphoethanolaminetransferase (alkaline phosphatase superfamily)
LIFFHLYGSHFPYAERVPHGFNVKDYTSKEYIGVAAENPFARGVFGIYIASIIYSEYIIKNMSTKIKNINNAPSLLIYMPDHGDDIFHGHGHSWFKFEWSMARIPLYIWAFPKYQARYPKKSNNYY